MHILPVLWCIFCVSKWVLANRPSSLSRCFVQMCFRYKWLKKEIHSYNCTCFLWDRWGQIVGSRYFLHHSLKFYDYLKTNHTVSYFSLQLRLTLNILQYTTVALSLSEQWHICLCSGTIYHYQQLSCISSVCTDARTQEISFMFCILLYRIKTLSFECLECCGHIE